MFRLHPLARSAAVLAALLTACSSEAPEPPGGTDVPPAAAGGTVHEWEHLRDETERLIAFLRGEAELEPALLADSVTLRIVPEGGREQRRVAREALADTAQWRVDSRSLVPPADLTHLTAAPGRHFNCFAGPLDPVAPDLATTPHVGVMLAESENASCLQTWNATFVFSGDPASPTLVAVVYDQWEW